MSLETVLRIVERAEADEEFRELLVSNPSRALRGEELSKSERAMLLGLRDSPYTSSPRGLADVRKMVIGAIAFRRPRPGLEPVAAADGDALSGDVARGVGDQKED